MTIEWNKVTWHSKITAVALFIILPFLGGWIWYNNASEKIVRVEEIVVLDEKETTEENSLPTNSYLNTNASTLAEQKELAFISYNQGGRRGSWLASKDKNNRWLDVLKVAQFSIVDEAVLADSEVYLNVRGNMSGPNDEWSTAVARVNILTNEFESVETKESVTNLLRGAGKVYAYGLSSKTCADSPKSLTNSKDCIGTLYEIELGGKLVVDQLANNLPGAHRLIAFDPASANIVLFGGYADGGCAWAEFVEYNLATKKITLLFKASGCAGDKNNSYEDYVDRTDEFVQKFKEKYVHSVYKSKTADSLIVKNNTVVPGEDLEDLNGKYFAKINIGLGE